MKKTVSLTILIFCFVKVISQIASTSSNLVALPVPDRTIFYNISDTGISKPIIWGLDLAWLSEENIRRGIYYLGADKIDVIRSSFTPTDSLVNGDLKPSELNTLNKRINIIKTWLGTNVKVALNCDHPSVHSWFVGNPARWAQLIDVTARRHQEAGLSVISVSPFNEPDYGWGQGTLNDFYNIAVELRKNQRFDNIRICGGNTLNTDKALSWYNSLKSKLDEGNTHQLAGSFDNYADFYVNVRTNGHHATNDELHNINDAMVGVEYGMMTGIWWGTTEYARSEFVKASDGRRLGYAEHRTNWTSASVYRNPEGKIKAFGGTSERQAITTVYRFVSKERDVFYDGYGPQREYIMVLPGGTGYQQGQTNAERVINITWGEDIQPVINGQYIIVNRASGKVMEIAEGSSAAGANIQQNNYKGYKYQQWNVTPVDPNIGGDFSYFSIKSVYSGKSLDILNWSLEEGGNIIAWDDTKGSNQQWFIEYAEDGWFYIRSRFSAKCIEVVNSSNIAGANIQQSVKKEQYNQQWRFIPVDAKVEFNAPEPPTNLVATPQAKSVKLEWTASTSSDVAGYTIIRADSLGGIFNTIARNVKSSSFIDNSVTISSQYFYKVFAVDSSLNKSSYSNEVSVTTINKKDIVMYLKFDGNTLDNSINLNHSATYGTITYVDSKDEKIGAILLNGTDAFIQLPYTIANLKEISITTWVYWNGGATWQRIFDFGNGENEYMYLTPKLRFAIKNQNSEQRLDASTLPVGEWVHVAVTLNDSKAQLYLNGKIVSQSTSITIRPIDFKPVLNYIGRGQISVPYFNGLLDDFRIYNYALDSAEITQVLKKNSLNENIIKNSQELLIYPVPANNEIYVKYLTSEIPKFLSIYIYNINGIMVLSKKFENISEVKISGLLPGIYIMKLCDEKRILEKKFIIEN
jgi:hypothetical protein